MNKCLVIMLAGLASVGGQAWAQGIYTCVDAKGRIITADRPIRECLDRTQRELTRSGLVKRQIGPALSPHEQALQDEKDRLAAEQQAREAEEKRRERALVLRYPSRAIHDQERIAALAQISEGIKASLRRAEELSIQRKAVLSEFEFYAKDPSRAPTPLKLKLEEVNNSLHAQEKFVQDQEAEKKRVNVRFDEELVRLKQLWALRGVPMSASAAASMPGSSKD